MKPLDELDRLCAEKVILVVIPSHPQYAADLEGNVWRLNNRWQNSKPRMCRTYNDMDGYPTVPLAISNKKYKAKKVHGLVCEAFRGPRPEGMQVRHLNGIKTDNRPQNLCWGTAKENCLDRFRHGTAIIGEKNHSSKLREKDIPIIRGLHKRGVQMKKIAQQYGVAPATIEKIIHKKTWRHVPES